jgi:hypothetical protein
MHRVHPGRPCGPGDDGPQALKGALPVVAAEPDAQPQPRALPLPSSATRHGMPPAGASAYSIRVSENPFAGTPCRVRGRPAPPRRLAGRPRRARRARPNHNPSFPHCLRPSRTPTPVTRGRSSGRAKRGTSSDGAIRHERQRPLGHTPESRLVINRHGLSERGDWAAGDDEGVAKSYYKAAWIGKLPMCAICGGAGDGPRAEHHLTHGISVWLCGAHRSDEFQRRRAGRDFVASLHAVWRAAGIRSKRHEAALSAHLNRVRRQPQRAQPGSYSWPGLRREAEHRFSAGEHPRRVIEDLRRQHAGLAANVPSVRTMRRWFSEARWLAPPAPPARTGTTNAGRAPAPTAMPRRWRPMPSTDAFAADEPAARDRPRSRVRSFPL